MNSNLTIAILAGLGGMVGWGLSEFATKKSVDVVGAISSLVWAHIFGTLILFSILFSRLFTSSSGAVLPANAGQWWQLVFFGTLQTTVYYFAYTAFEKGEVSILSPIFASFAGIVALMSVLLFGESLSIGLIPGLILIFAGTILINLDIKSLRKGEVRMKAVDGLKEIIIATVLAATWTLGWNKAIVHKDLLVYTSFMFLFMTISAIVLALRAKVAILKAQTGVWKFLVLIAIGEVFAYIAISAGYANNTHTSIVAVLSGASSLITIVLAHIFIKEKMTRVQVISSFVIIAGIALLAAIQ